MAAIKIDPDEFLCAAAEMHGMIAEANEVLMRAAYMIRENVDRCYRADLPGHEPYTNGLLSLMQRYENYATDIEKQMQVIERYREYLDECFMPIMPIPDPAKLFAIQNPRFEYAQNSHGVFFGNACVICIYDKRITSHVMMTVYGNLAEASQLYKGTALMLKKEFAPSI